MRTMPRTATNEAVTSSMQMTICAPNNRSRRANRRRGVASTGPLFIACNGLLCHTCRAGIIPNSSPLTSVRIRAYHVDTRIHVHCTARPANDAPRFSAPSSSAAVISPAAPPMIDNTIASVSSCLTNRHRLDPKADAKRQFPAAIRRARRKQTGQIRACCHQHQQSERGHAVEKSANDITIIAVESGMDQSQRHSGVCLWILLRQLGRDRTQILRRLLRRHARLEPAKHRHAHGCPVLQVIPLDLLQFTVGIQ